MRMRSPKGPWIAALCAALACLALAAPARAASSTPLFVFVPTAPGPLEHPQPPPVGYLEGPCGIGVDTTAHFYVSDHYHDAVDLFGPPPSPFTSPPSYQGQMANVDPLDGPCALAFDSSNHLYVNDFHRSVAGFDAFGSLSGAPIAGAGVDETHPTGVAVDPGTGRVYVDERTFIGVYEASGAPVEEGGEAIRIGLDPDADYYGLALSRYSSTAGYLYLADATTKTVKVFDPAALDKATPVAEIHGPGAGFTSLRDSALAVDWTTGVTYVADDLQPSLTEEPQAQVDVFGPSGSYLGVLKYKVIDALPPGLAVDNSATPSQGRVYLTSGNTDQAGIYAYGPGAQTAFSSPPAVGFTVRSTGSGSGKVMSSLGDIDCTSTCEAQIRSGAELTLTATPDPGSAFVGWSGGGCEGTASCSVAMVEAREVTASFGELSGPPAPSVSALAPSGQASVPPKSRHRVRRRHRRHRHRHRHRPAA